MGSVAGEALRPQPFLMYLGVALGSYCVSPGSLLGSSWVGLGHFWPLYCHVGALGASLGLILGQS